ncbi:LysR family transcriptional regulator, partial [Klebsiella pneumoniae]
PICQRLDRQNFCWIPLQSELRWELGMIWREGVYMSRSAEAWLTCSKAFWLE